MRFKVEYRNKKNGIYSLVKVTNGGALEIYDASTNPKHSFIEGGSANSFMRPGYRLRGIVAPDAYRGVFVIYDNEDEGWT